MRKGRKGGRREEWKERRKKGRKGGRSKERKERNNKGRKEEQEEKENKRRHFYGSSGRKGEGRKLFTPLNYLGSEGRRKREAEN